MHCECPARDTPFRSAAPVFASELADAAISAPPAPAVERVEPRGHWSPSMCSCSSSRADVMPPAGARCAFIWWAQCCMYTAPRGGLIDLITARR